jgi:phosphoribosylanthranilate isomerase
LQFHFEAIMFPIQVKICGLTNLEDARVAIGAGADLLGFILFPKSPRYVSPEQVGVILQELQTQRFAGEGAAATARHFPRTVGVFVNEPVEQVAQILAQTGLDYAQLHGDETPALLLRLTGRAFKALRPQDQAEALQAAQQFAPLGPPTGPTLMIDAFDPAAYGGTGKQADWHAAAAVAQQYPGLLLAGGLTPENVAAAIRTVQPWGVDVSSGVEASPGRKNHERVRAFVQAAKQIV